MNWSLVCEVNCVTLGKLGMNDDVTAGDDKGVNHLHPSLVQKDYPPGENLRQLKMFINRYLAMGGNYLVEMHTEGWLHSTKR